MNPAGPLPALQARSRKTARAILDSALALLATKEYSEVSVSDIAGRAGVSVGGFYARFASKAALLHALDDQIHHLVADAVESAFAGTEERELEPVEILHCYLRAVAEVLRQHRVSIDQIRRHAHPDDATLFVERARGYYESVGGGVRDRLLAHLEREGRRSARAGLAVNLAIYIVSATLRDAVVAQGLKAVPVAIDTDSLVRELASAAVAYIYQSQQNPTRIPITKR